MYSLCLEHCTCLTFQSASYYKLLTRLPVLGEVALHIRLGLFSLPRGQRSDARMQALDHDRAGLAGDCGNLLQIRFHCKF